MTRRFILTDTLITMWWRVRGVGHYDYRKLCSRCGRTGVAHWHWKGCWRFKEAT